MNWNRLKSFFENIFFLWILAPLVLDIDVSDYVVFIAKGFGIAGAGAFVFYALDLLTNKILRSFK